MMASIYFSKGFMSYFPEGDLTPHVPKIYLNPNILGNTQPNSTNEDSDENISDKILIPIKKFGKGF